MTTPRIEEMVEDVASVCDQVEFLRGVPVKLPSETKALLRGKIRKALTQAHQAGIDEVVEYLRETFKDDCEIGVSHLFLELDTIKALQDNK